MVRFCDAAVKAGTYQTPYRRVLALFFPRCAPPRRTVLAGVTLQLARGAALAVLGDAEALLHLAAGEVACAAGTAELRGHTARADGEGDTLLPFLTGRANARLFARLGGLRGSEVAARVREAQAVYEEIAALQPPPQTARHGAERFDAAVAGYSPAARAALALAIALSQEPDTLLLDGCLTRFPPPALAAVCARIAARRAGGMCLLVHESQEIAQLLCPRAIWIEHGAVQGIGPLARIAAMRRAARCTRPVMICTLAVRASARPLSRRGARKPDGTPPDAAK